MVPLVVLVAALLMIACERARPGRAWPEVAGWWTRALAFNGLQALAVLTLGRAVDGWIAALRPWSADALGTVGGALVGYLALTFVYYWWHRARHEVPLLWRWLHQLHHSPRRLEVLTSFYKHPLELVTNTLIPGAVLYLGVGLGPEAATGATLLAGLAELFYHWNVKTPRWLGWVIQRPESHCLHHEAGVHARNYGDLPLWDLLFGTFESPATFDGRCGFGDAEARVGDMLLGRDVLAPAPARAPAPTTTPRDRPGAARGERRATLVASGLLALGLAQMLADAAGALPVKALAAATAASPAPKVFTTVRGHELLSTAYALEWTDAAGRARVTPIDAERAAGLRGPYIRRNVYGAVLSYGPVLAADPRTRPLFEAVAARAFSGRWSILPELGLDPRDVRGPVRVRYAPREGLFMFDLPRALSVDVDGEGS